jgi:hypothetical protein
MPHYCDATCGCRKDLNVALAALKQSTRLLESFIVGGSMGLIEKHYADVRMANIRLKAAIDVYRDHLAEAGA